MTYEKLEERIENVVVLGEKGSNTASRGGCGAAFFPYAAPTASAAAAVGADVPADTAADAAAATVFWEGKLVLAIGAKKSSCASNLPAYANIRPTTITITITTTTTTT